MNVNLAFHFVVVFSLDSVVLDTCLINVFDIVFHMMLDIVLKQLLIVCSISF